MHQGLVGSMPRAPPCGVTWQWTLWFPPPVQMVKKPFDAASSADNVYSGTRQAKSNDRYFPDMPNCRSSYKFNFPDSELSPPGPGLDDYPSGMTTTEKQFYNKVIAFMQGCEKNRERIKEIVYMGLDSLEVLGSDVKCLIESPAMEMWLYEMANTSDTDHLRIIALHAGADITDLSRRTGLLAAYVCQHLTSC